MAALGITLPLLASLALPGPAPSAVPQAGDGELAADAHPEGELLLMQVADEEPAAAAASPEPGAEPEGEPTPPPPPPDWERRVDPTLLEAILEGRRRPGYQPGLPEAVTQDNPGAIRALPPSAFPTK